MSIGIASSHGRRQLRFIHVTWLQALVRLRSSLLSRKEWAPLRRRILSTFAARQMRPKDAATASSSSRERLSDQAAVLAIMCSRTRPLSRTDRAHGWSEYISIRHLMRCESARDKARSAPAALACAESHASIPAPYQVVACLRPPLWFAPQGPLGRHKSRSVIMLLRWLLCSSCPQCRRFGRVNANERVLQFPSVRSCWRLGWRFRDNGSWLCRDCLGRSMQSSGMPSGE